MSSKSVTHASFTIERRFKSSPSKVFDAFADPEKKRRWFAEGETSRLDSYELDFRVGGRETARYRFTAGKPIAEGTPFGNDTVYMDIVENTRIVTAYSMVMEEVPFSSSLSTLEFIADDDGTLLVFTEQAAFYENADGPEMREQGWQHLFGSLAKELGE